MSPRRTASGPAVRASVFPLLRAGGGARPGPTMGINPPRGSSHYTHRGGRVAAAQMVWMCFAHSCVCVCVCEDRGL